MNGGAKIAVYALALVDSLDDFSVLSEDAVVSMAESEFVSVREKVVYVLGKNLNVLKLEVNLRIFLGLFSDMYAGVRMKAILGVVELFKRDSELINWSTVKFVYEFVVECLRDKDMDVRLAAVELAGECGRLFAECEGGNEIVDLIFVQISWMTRDMCSKVRIGAFIALGKLKLVSESVLLQSLSKKILRSKSGESSLAECIIQGSKFSLSGAPGAFVHGIEDEFHEVRTAAVKSLGILAKFSIKFTDNALNLLMDLLNDDVTAVRLKTLETLLHMSREDCLTVQEKHVHMFLCLLEDVSAEIRHEARKVLRLMEIPKSDIFTSSVDCLITNLVMHPEEEEDIFSALFHIGKRHGNFAAKRVKEFEVKISPNSEGELNLDSPQAVVLLVLAISVTFSSKSLKYKVSPAIFCFAIPLIGRVSQSLRNTISFDILLAHLSVYSGLPFPAKLLKSDTELLPVEGNLSTVKRCTSLVCSSTQPVSNGLMCTMEELSIFPEQSRQKMNYFDEDTIQSANVVIKTVAETWWLIKSSQAQKAQRILSACREELEMISWNVDGSQCSLLAFASYHVQVVQLISDIWNKFQSHNVGMNTFAILFEKLDTSLKQLRYRFSGFSGEEEYYILELTLLCYVLRAYTAGIWSHHTLNKLQPVIYRIDYLSKVGQLKFSNFYEELKKLYIEQRSNHISTVFPARSLCLLYHPEQITFSSEIQHIKAELSATGDNSEDPLIFISGLPVSITFNVKLSNISNKSILWLRMFTNISIQYMFLDVCKFENSNHTSKCTVTVPYYGTPKATNFVLKASVCMEIPAEMDVHCDTGHGEPENEVVILSKEIDIWLKLRDNNM